MGVILFIISFLLVGLFTPIGMMFTIMRSLFTLNIKPINDYYLKLAISLDRFGNVVMGGMFNFILINDTKHQFGDDRETISSVLGKNKINKSLSYFGRRLDALLNGLDEGHSVKSIKEFD